MLKMLMVAGVGTPLSGCASTNIATSPAPAPGATGSFGYGTSEQPIDPAMAVYMPWQLGPSSPKTKAAHDEPIVTVNVPQWGPVKGRADVLASFPAPLAAAPGPNRTVEPCREQALEAAQRYNPNTQVEAASVGRERRLANGRYQGQVRLRVVYTRPNFHEVREAILECTTTGAGRFERATAIWPT